MGSRKGAIGKSHLLSAIAGRASRRPDRSISVGTVVIVNVQNGRSTVLTAARTFNQGYQPYPLYPCDASNRDAGWSN